MRSRDAYAPDGSYARRCPYKAISLHPRRWLGRASGTSASMTNNPPETRDAYPWSCESISRARSMYYIQYIYMPRATVRRSILMIFLMRACDSCGLYLTLIAACRREDKTYIAHAYAKHHRSLAATTSLLSPIRARLKYRSKLANRARDFSTLRACALSRRARLDGAQPRMSGDARLTGARAAPARQSETPAAARRCARTRRDTGLA